MPRLRLIACALVALACVVAIAARTEARWSDPGGDERAPLSLPPADGRYFGANDVFERHRGQRVLRAISRAGANVARRTLSWWHSEPARGVWAEPSWEAAQRFHDGALAREMTPIHVLGFAPTWARKRGTRGCQVVGKCEFPPRRRMIDAWAAFAAEAARRFEGAIFEVWNEPNLRDFWQPEPDPELWAELVVAAHDAIKAVDPDATVIACGCAGIIDRGRPRIAIPVKEFLTRAYDHGSSIQGHFDGISVHLFPQTATLEGDVDRALAFGRNSMLAALLDAVRSTAEEHGEVPEPVWITEAGYWMGSSDHPETELEDAEVAEAFSRLARRVFSTVGIKALIVHRAQDTGRSDRSELGTREASFGLIEKGKALTPKPSFCVFAGLAGDHGFRGCEGRTGPAARFLSPPQGPTPPGAVSLSIEAPADAATLECRIGDRPYGQCPEQVRVRSDRPGRYTVRARARDSAGKAGVAARARWHVRKPRRPAG